MGRHKKLGRKRTLTKKQYLANQQENTRSWRKEHEKSCNLSLNIVKDADIIEWLNKQPNKQQYIKSLIRKDIQ